MLIRIAWLAVLAATACAGPGRPSLLVGAASSMEPFLTPLALRFEEEAQIEVTVVYGASGSLAAQVEQGAPLDVVASADVLHLQRLVGQGLVREDNAVRFAEGSLVLIAAPELSLGTDWRDAVTDERVRHVVMANPAVAPYGRASREALMDAGLWEHIQPRLVYVESVAQAFQLVRGGGAEVGFVAASLLPLDAGDLAALPIDRCAHAPLPQVVAPIAHGRAEAEAERFVRFITGPAGQEALAGFGYLPPRSVTGCE